MFAGVTAGWASTATPRWSLRASGLALALRSRGLALAQATLPAPPQTPPKPADIPRKTRSSCDMHVAEEGKAEADEGEDEEEGG